jgi:hypothetical protein
MKKIVLKILKKKKKKAKPVPPKHISSSSNTNLATNGVTGVGVETVGGIRFILVVLVVLSCENSEALHKNICAA